MGEHRLTIRHYWWPMLVFYGLTVLLVWMFAYSNGEGDYTTVEFIEAQSLHGENLLSASLKDDSNEYGNENGNENENGNGGPIAVLGSEEKLKWVCPEGYFKCQNSSICIPQKEICDGKFNCPQNDHSDEANCKNTHDKNFWDSLFQKRPGADAEINGTCKYFPKNRVIEDSSGSSEEPVKESGNTFQDLQDHCECLKEKLFCHNLQISTFSNIRFPSDLEFLDLTGSQVSTDILEERGSELEELKTLILATCSINEVKPGVFSQLRKLETLHLTGNLVSKLPQHVFFGNSKLKRLNLGYNLLRELSPGSFARLYELVELDLRHNKLRDKELVGIFKDLSSLKTLYLSDNELEILDRNIFHGLVNLETLSLASNKISTIGENVFHDMLQLKNLYLSWNKLTIISNFEFCNLRSLVNLNLNGNKLREFQPESFACLTSLESLNLEKNDFGELENEPRRIFASLVNLTHIYFDQFFMCWWTPHVRHCEPKGDGISSVENLLDNILLRTCVWLMAILAIVGNFFVIISRMLLREPNPVHSFYIKNLAVADLLMGFFLLSIAMADVSFRGEYLTKQHAWRHSMTCQMSGLLCTISSEASVLILTVITLDRYLSIIRPFAERSSHLSPPIFIMTFLWTISIILSYAPLSQLFPEYFGSNFYTSNGLCLPLQLHNPYDDAWEYSFFLFVVINSVAFTFICYAYWKMLRIIQGSSLMIRSNQQKQDSVLTLRFGLVVLTDFLCWAPVIITKTLAMSGVPIPPDLYAWLAVFALPINSALNPLIYSITSKLFRQQLNKLTGGFRKRLRITRDLDESSHASSFSFFNRNRTQRQTITTNSMHTASIRGANKTVGVRGNGALHIQMTTFATNCPPTNTNSNTTA